MSSLGVGSIVHYVARGSADGVFPPTCRAAIVAEIPEGALPPAERYSHELSSDDVVADLVVLNPSGLFFNRCVADEHERRPGTFHSVQGCNH